VLARYPLTAKTVEEEDAMLATNDGRGKNEFDGMKK
jgi:hypothetical protein